jgi:DUF4097 and DUF4098 domain-containing protein YvlB
MPRTVLAGTVALLAVAGAAAAQGRVEERRPASPDGVVEIDNPNGSVQVTGWDRAEIVVTGQLGPGTDGLEFEVGKGRAQISVSVDGDPHGPSSSLDIKVPAGSRLKIDSYAGRIDVKGIKGSVSADTVQGRIVIAESAGEVEAQSVNGSIDISGSPRRVQADCVNGSVTVAGASGEVEATTVNGRLSVAGSTFNSVSLETVNGQITFDGELKSGASLRVESVGGGVELHLPASTSADFTVTTFSGGVRNDLGPAPARSPRHGGDRELSFTVGGGSAKVSVETLSGEIAILKK